MSYNIIIHIIMYTNRVIQYKFYVIKTYLYYMLEVFYKV
jgi:hypothetical protein